MVDTAPGSRARKARLAALVLGLALAAGLGGALWRATRGDRPPAPAGLDRARVAELLARRGAESTRPDALPGVPARPEDSPWYVPRADAVAIFEVLTRVNQYDPWCYYAHKPHYRQAVAWPEHPRGRWTYSTNGAGLRDDEEVRANRPGLRVVVTGDSHVAGFCDNADSFANRLEASIAARHPKLGTEVLNAANLAYSFHHYAGVVAKHAVLEPHVYVVTVHGGNDLREALLPQRYFARLPLPPQDVEAAPAGRAGEIFVPASHQGLLSVARFRDDPGEVELARRAARDTFAWMQAVCRARGSALVCAYLPAPIEVERQRLADLLEPTMRALDLTDADLAAHAAHVRAVLDDIADLGVEVHDLTPALRAAPGPCYWRQDLHLNLLGHAIAARELEPVVLRAAGIGG